MSVSCNRVDSLTEEKCVVTQPLFQQESSLVSFSGGRGQCMRVQEALVRVVSYSYSFRDQQQRQKLHPIVWGWPWTTHENPESMRYWLGLQGIVLLVATKSRRGKSCIRSSLCRAFNTHYIWVRRIYQVDLRLDLKR